MPAKPRQQPIRKPLPEHLPRETVNRPGFAGGW
jgi:transposase